MKIVYKNKSENASVLVVALCIGLVLGIALAGYFQLVNTHYLLNSRSEAWNSSLTVAEAGVDDALQFVNIHNDSLFNLTNWPTVATHNGWDEVSANVYYSRKAVSNDFYDVYITNTFGGSNIVITSIGNVHFNYKNQIIQRTVVVNASLDPVFSVAMAAIKTIDLKGNNIFTDGFDSSDPNFSNNGQYPMGNLAKTKASGDLVTDGDVINTLSVGNAKVKGVIRTGPNGTATVGAGGSVGDRAWVESGTKGVQDNHYFNDFNVLFPDVTVPSGSWLPLGQTSQKIDGVTYDYVIRNNGDYIVPAFKNFYVASNVTARVRFDVAIKVSGQVYVCNGAKVEVYESGDTFSVGGLINENGTASSLYLYGTPNCTKVSFGGNANFVGVIYAPEADFQLGGGGSTTFDFIGCSVTKSVQMNGHFNLHYDEFLKRTGWKGYTVTNWREQ